MLKWLARRLLELTVLGFAALGFFCVPLGKRTAYEHTHALVMSPEARAVGETIWDTAKQIHDTARAFQTELRRELLDEPDPA